MNHMRALIKSLRIFLKAFCALCFGINSKLIRHATHFKLAISMYYTI